MNDVILIMGMHRSGTSCLTGCLRNYGLNLGEVSNYNKYNEKGNQEDRQIFRLNEQIFSHNGGSWNKLPETLNTSHEQIKKRNEIISHYDSFRKPWGIKDPRMLINYEFWQAQLPKHALVGTIRHPKAVVDSLASRKNLSVPEDVGFLLWEQYNLKLLKLYQQQNFPIINFDLSQSEYLLQVKNIAHNLGLTTSTQNTFFEPSLRHQKTYSINDCPGNLKQLYTQLLALTL